MAERQAVQFGSKSSVHVAMPEEVRIQDETSRRHLVYTKKKTAEIRIM